MHAIYLKGPVKITGMSDSPSRQKIFICKPANAGEELACAKKIVANLAGKAFRRPVTDEDVLPLMRFYDKSRKDGHSFDEGVARFAVPRSWRARCSCIAPKPPTTAAAAS